MTKKKNNSPNAIPSPPLVEAMQQFIADETALFIKAKNYHWNVLGVHFKPLHELFDTIAEACEEQIDEVAERIRALNAFVPASLAYFAQKTTIEEESKIGSLKAEKMLESLLKDYINISDSLKKAISIADDEDDDVTEDMLIGILAAHDKMAWMLRSHLQ